MMKFIKVTSKTLFKPSFGHKNGQTDFYQILINDSPIAEIEVKPQTGNGSPEILSLYTDSNYRGMGVGKMLVTKVLETYLVEEMFVLTTKQSRTFWIKMGAIKYNEFLYKFTK